MYWNDVLELFLTKLSKEYWANLSDDDQDDRMKCGMNSSYS